MTESVRDAMVTVPAGKVRLAECGTYSRELNATRTKIAEAIGAVHSYPMVTFCHETRGYVIAGSCMRWQEANWSVLYWLQDGTRHGRRFLDEADAREYFAKLTDHEAVSRRRQEDAMLEDTVYRPAREAAATRKAEHDAKEKARKSAIRKVRREWAKLARS